MAAGGAVMFVGVAVAAAGWRRVHAASGAMLTDGPYATVRYPQYSGLILTIVGALIQWPTVITLVMAPILVATYLRLARREESAMVERFEPAYERYMAQVPMLVPRRPRRTDVAAGPVRKERAGLP